MTSKLETWCIAALLLGILNAFVRPDPDAHRAAAADFHARPVHARHQRAAALFRQLAAAADFHVDSFGYAFLGALIISIVSIALNVLTGNARVTVRLNAVRRPPKNPGDDDDKPVIDV